MKPKSLYAIRSLLANTVDVTLMVTQKIWTMFFKLCHVDFSKTFIMSSNFRSFINSLIWDPTKIHLYFHQLFWEISLSNTKIHFYCDPSPLQNFFVRPNLIWSERKIHPKAFQVVNALHFSVQKLDIYVQDILFYYSDLISPIHIKSSRIPQ